MFMVCQGQHFYSCRDYKAEKARTLGTLGLDGYSMEELLRIL